MNNAHVECANKAMHIVTHPMTKSHDYIHNVYLPGEELADVVTVLILMAGFLRKLLTYRG